MGKGRVKAGKSLSGDWPEIVQELRAICPDPADSFLGALLLQAKSALVRDQADLPKHVRRGIVLKQKVLREALALVSTYLEPIRTQDKYEPVTVQEERDTAFLAGVQFAFDLFDVLFTTRKGGISKSVVLQSWLGRQAGYSVGGREVKHPRKFVAELTRWEALATELLTEDRTLSNNAVYIEIAYRLNYSLPEKFGPNRIYPRLKFSMPGIRRRLGLGTR